MIKASQKRTLETRARLIAVAQHLITQKGYAGFRVEDVVRGATVAKGTFFAHFKDKDTLMELLIGAEINRFLDQMEARPAPENIDQLADAQLPLLEFMTSERYVFDVILRYSGAAAISEIGSISMTFGRQGQIFTHWIETGPFRKDVSSTLLAEGIQALATNTMALKFCALHTNKTLRERLISYLKVWLTPCSLPT